jgi:flavin-dependent dehydrogenase
MLLGDAAGLVDPLTGEGIYYALQSGIIAARAIIQKDSPEQATAFYQHSVAREIFPELSAAGRIAGLFFRFGGVLFDLAELNRRIARYFCRVTSGEISYRLRDADRKLLRDIRQAVVSQ